MLLSQLHLYLSPLWLLILFINKETALHLADLPKLCGKLAPEIRVRGSSGSLLRPFVKASAQTLQLFCVCNAARSLGSPAKTPKANQLVILTAH
uniref:LD28571p n=1 Tax=Drosophila melanogaster TaxID=7227 RepID=Q95TE0_DROME|nr:LD28571p [Drosophila melanogaster]